jgi:hypothetical protein
MARLRLILRTCRAVTPSRYAIRAVSSPISMRLLIEVRLSSVRAGGMARRGFRKMQTERPIRIYQELQLLPNQDANWTGGRGLFSITRKTMICVVAPPKSWHLFGCGTEICSARYVGRLWISFSVPQDRWNPRLQVLTQNGFWNSLHGVALRKGHMAGALVSGAVRRHPTRTICICAITSTRADLATNGLLTLLRWMI